MTQDSPHIVIFSHDFGVRREDRGLFTAIARALPDAKSVLFSYSSINEEANTVTVMPLSEQTRKLRKIINGIRTESPNAIIDLVCHGQGCVVAGILKPRGIRKVIFITPPADMGEAVVAGQLGSHLSSPIDMAVRARLSQSDGSTIVIHPDYWQSLAGVEPVKLYNRLAKVTPLRIINAGQDEVQGNIILEGIDPRISLVTLAGNHYFSDEETRARLLYILQKELALQAERA